MKRIFLFISIICIVIALFLYLFNPIQEYDFFTALKLGSNLEFNNPIEQFEVIGKEFEAFGNVFSNSSGNWWNDFWNGIQQFFEVIWTLLKAPVLLVYDLVMDLVQGFRFLLIMLGFY